MTARANVSEKARVAVDLSTIRYLLALTPEERVRLAAAEARNLRLFDLEVEKSKRR
ncbi:MAG TPA: hypothetical protein VGR95_08230 [Thermoanaerobaculia bacterium]|nr:hypothetical protein [Thermoanaerobaculia bacterium]